MGPAVNIVLGPFHPHLEEALVRELVARKADDPWAPVLVVVPSDGIRRRLAWHLAAERRLTLVNVSILTFHQLSRRLVAEAGGEHAPDLVDDRAFEELLRVVIERGEPRGVFAGVAATPGGCSALWQTLRDLKDAKMPPEALADAVGESLFAPEDRPRLSALAAVYREVFAAARLMGWIDYTDLDALAADAAATSAYLTAQRVVAYYGFYDLTQAQYDVFRAVAARVDVTLYFPLVPDHPAWVFAGRFFERYALGLAGRAPRVPASSPPSRLFADDASPVSGDRPADSGPAACMLRCSGPGDEAATCAKEILRLVEEEGFAFHEIGVVARSLEPYAAIIAREFARHGIPSVTSARRPLARFPAAQAVLRLLRVADGEPGRQDVIDLLWAASFRVEPFLAGGTAQRESTIYRHARPALWDALAREAGVERGFEAWERVRRMIGPGDEAGSAPDRRGGNQRPTVTLEAQAAVVLRIVDGLRRLCDGLPESASGLDHATAWRGVLATVLGLAAEREATIYRHARDDDDGESAPEDPGNERAVIDALLAALDAPARLDRVRPVLPRRAYVDAVRRGIDAAAIPATDPRAGGVAVLDAMAARGVAFRALFVLGMNEGVFPRVVREDAFLRDRDRRVIEATLGYKIPEKLAGYDEERLLFAVLTQAARDRLYLSTQRADEGGRPLAPSWYLDAWRRASGPVDATIVDIPRRARDKRGVAPFDRVERLTPREGGIVAALLGDEPGRLSDDRTRAILDRVGPARRSCDAWGSALTPYDGDVGALPEWVAGTRAEGYSASLLQTYAECPWRVFVTRVLHAAPLADAEEQASPGSAEWGALAHEALARLYREWPGDRDRAVARIDTIWREVCERYAASRAVGYPLVWEVETARIGAFLVAVVAEDAAELLDTGSRPIETEIVLSATIDRPRPVPIRGRLDRIDSAAGGLGATGGGLRVIDWKFQWTGSHDRLNLVTQALRGLALQPPLYAALAAHYAGSAAAGERREADVSVAVAVYAVRPHSRDGLVERLPYRPDPETAGRIGDTIASLVSGIEDGLFPMIPDRYCAWCNVAAACRRRHAPSRARAERDPRAARLAAIRATPARDKDASA